MLWGSRHQSQQQLQQQLALQVQCLMTHHYVQHLLQILAVYLRTGLTCMRLAQQMTYNAYKHS